MSAQEENITFQPDAGERHWMMHFRSSPAKVYQAIATHEGRATYWAESAVEKDGSIHFVVPGGETCDGRVIERTPGMRFPTEYLGWTVMFELTLESQSGTDLQIPDIGTRSHRSHGRLGLCAPSNESRGRLQRRSEKSRP